MFYVRFSEPLKEELAPVPLAIDPVDPATVTCSIFVQRLQSFSCVMYLYVPLFFLSFPSAPVALLLNLYRASHEPGPAQGFSL